MGSLHIYHEEARQILGSSLRACNKDRAWHYCVTADSSNVHTLGHLLGYTMEEFEGVLLHCGLAKRQVTGVLVVSIKPKELKTKDAGWASLKNKSNNNQPNVDV